jgi:4-amino-4-deoxy-L-arabinose transferase-like glycosyltransferase
MLLAGSVLLLFGGLGQLPLFSRDEALYAEASREMYAGGDWITPRINALAFYEKPPLYYWATAVCLHIFGVSPFAVRFPAALAAVLTILLTALLGTRLWGRRAGFLAGLALLLSLQIPIIGRMGIMDMPLTCLILLTLLAYEQWCRRPRFSKVLQLGLCIGLAILLKGMAGLIAPAIIFFHILLFQRAKGKSLILPAAVAIIIAAALAAPWFIIMGIRHGGAYGATFFIHEHLIRMTKPLQGHSGPVWYYLGIMLISFFPWIMLLPAALCHREAPFDKEKAFWRSLAMVWMGLVLIPFSLMQTKLPGYITPLFPALALLAGAELDRRLNRPGRAPWIAIMLGAMLLAGGALYLPAYAATRTGIALDPRQLTTITLICGCGYFIMLLGGLAGLLRPAVVGIWMLSIGQLLVVAAVLFGVLPAASPYLGGSEAQLAAIAQRELPKSKILLYHTYPEGVAFVLQRPAPVYNGKNQAELIKELQTGPSALLARARDKHFWEQLPRRRMWRAGGHVLLDIPKIGERGEGLGARNGKHKG